MNLKSFRVLSFLLSGYLFFGMPTFGQSLASPKELRRELKTQYKCLNLTQEFNHILRDLPEIPLQAKTALLNKELARFHRCTSKYKCNSILTEHLQKQTVISRDNPSRDLNSLAQKSLENYHDEITRLEQRLARLEDLPKSKSLKLRAPGEGEYPIYLIVDNSLNSSVCATFDEYITIQYNYVPFDVEIPSAILTLFSTDLIPISGSLALSLKEGINEWVITPDLPSGQYFFCLEIDGKPYFQEFKLL